MAGTVADRAKTATPEIPQTTGAVQVVHLNKSSLKVVVCVSKGLSNREIAAELGITEGTVRNYVSAILHKTGFEHKTQIAIHALKGGFVARIPAPKNARKQKVNKFLFNDPDRRAV